MTYFGECFRCTWKDWVFCRCWLWCSVLSSRASWLIHGFLFTYSLNSWDWNVKIPKHNWCTRLNGGGCCSVPKSGVTLWDPLDCSTPGFPFICCLPWFAQIRVHSGASLVAQMAKNLPAMQDTRVWSLGQEQPLEKGITTYSSILAWGTPWTEKPGRLQSVGFSSKHYLFILCFGLPWWLSGKESICNAGDPCLISGSGRAPGGGHGNPLQYSCLENPMDEGGLVGYSPWGCKESDTTEATEHTCCPLSLWCHQTIPSSVIPFSSYPQSLSASGSFPGVGFTSSGQSVGASASAPVLPVNIQGWFSLGLTDLISLLSKGPLKSLLRHHS